ncbi:hypothetical protein BJ170DRAFT_646059 [Xylariales sp. AK1849]|nr:hypothetical protein BJ170DRAFT_646059 [Xylariales sp. AK1849]
MQEAEKMYLRAFQGYEKYVGPQHIARFRPARNTTWGYGALLRDQGKLPESRTYYQRAYDNLEALVGPQHEHVLLLRKDLLDVNQRMHDTVVPQQVATKRRRDALKRALRMLPR